MLPLKDPLKNTNYHKNYYWNNKEKWIKYYNERTKDPDYLLQCRIKNKKYRDSHKEIIKERQRIFFKNHREQYKRNYYNQRIKALKIVGKGIIKCTRCGCDDYRALEINHINGGGTREKKQIGYGSIMKYVLHNNRNTDDLEILCRPCNQVHYLQMKYGINKLKVIWNGKI